MPALPPHELFALKLSCLNYGYALFEPNPNGAYDYVRVGDVGYVSEDGKFVKLFNAFSDAGAMENEGSCLPINFEPISERFRRKDKLEPLPPGLRKSESVQVIGGGLSMSGPILDLVASGSMTLSCSSRCGAALITKCRGTRHKALASKAMEDYMISNLPSWIQLAHDLGQQIEMHDFIFVRECILTGDWATISWNNSRCDAQVDFQVGLPDVANVGLSFWGQWQQHVEVPARQGPFRDTPVQNDSVVLDQCIFLKGLRISERGWNERVVYLLKSSTSEKLFGKQRAGKSVLKSLSDRNFKITTVGNYDASFRSVQNAYDVLALYIFETSDADLALIDDNDLFSLGLHGTDTLEDICKIILDTEANKPTVDVSPGQVKVGRISWKEMQLDMGERTNLVVLDESMNMIRDASPIDTQGSPESNKLSRSRLGPFLPSEMYRFSELSRKLPHPANLDDDQPVAHMQVSDHTAHFPPVMDPRPSFQRQYHPQHQSLFLSDLDAPAHRNDHPGSSSPFTPFTDFNTSAVPADTFSITTKPSAPPTPFTPLFAGQAGSHQNSSLRFDISYVPGNEITQNSPNPNTFPKSGNEDQFGDFDVSIVAPEYSEDGYDPINYDAPTDNSGLFSGGDTMAPPNAQPNSQSKKQNQTPSPSLSPSVDLSSHGGSVSITPTTDNSMDNYESSYDHSKPPTPNDDNNDDQQHQQANITRSRGSWVSSQPNDYQGSSTFDLEGVHLDASPNLSQVHHSRRHEQTRPRTPYSSSYDDRDPPVYSVTRPAISRRTTWQGQASGQTSHPQLKKHHQLALSSRATWQGQASGQTFQPQLKIHRQLACSTAKNGAPAILYNVTRAPSPDNILAPPPTSFLALLTLRSRAPPQPVPTHTLALPATRPFVPSLILSLPGPSSGMPIPLPREWRIEAVSMSATDPQHTALTNLDVLHAVYSCLREPVSRREWVALGAGSNAQRRIAEAYSKRCEKSGSQREWDAGVRRVDWLCGRTMLYGVECSGDGTCELVFGKASQHRNGEGVPGDSIYMNGSRAASEVSVTTLASEGSASSGTTGTFSSFPPSPLAVPADLTPSGALIARYFNSLTLNPLSDAGSVDPPALGGYDWEYTAQKLQTIRDTDEGREEDDEIDETKADAEERSAAAALSAFRSDARSTFVGVDDKD